MYVFITTDFFARFELCTNPPRKVVFKLNALRCTLFYPIMNIVEYKNHKTKCGNGEENETLCTLTHALTHKKNFCHHKSFLVLFHSFPSFFFLSLFSYHANGVQTVYHKESTYDINAHTENQYKKSWVPNMNVRIRCPWQHHGPWQKLFKNMEQNMERSSSSSSMHGCLFGAW